LAKCYMLSPKSNPAVHGKRVTGNAERGKGTRPGNQEAVLVTASGEKQGREKRETGCEKNRNLFGSNTRKGGEETERIGKVTVA